MSSVGAQPRWSCGYGTQLLICRSRDRILAMAAAFLWRRNVEACALCDVSARQQAPGGRNFCYDASHNHIVGFKHRTPEIFHVNFHRSISRPVHPRNRHRIFNVQKLQCRYLGWKRPGILQITSSFCFTNSQKKKSGHPFPLFESG